MKRANFSNNRNSHESKYMQVLSCFFEANCLRKKTPLKKFRIFSLLLIFTFQSCDNFLETIPRDKYSSDTFYTTPEAADMAVTSVYNALVNDDLFLYRYENVARPLESGGDLFTSNFSTPYNLFWRGITDGNIALEKLPDIDFNGDETTRNYLIAQVRFLRAYYYHMISMFLGPVPLITNTLAFEEYNTITRADDIDVIRDFIIEEVLAAEPDLLLRSQSSNGRVTKGCADYLLANVYMYQKNWTEAEKWLKKIIDSQEYSLLPNYTDICSYDTKLDVCNAWEYTNESLFEVGLVEGAAGYSDRFTDRQTPKGCSGSDYRALERRTALNFYNRVLMIDEDTIIKTVSKDSTWLNKRTGKYVTTEAGQKAVMPNYVEDPRRPDICVKWGDVVPCPAVASYYVDATSSFFAGSSYLLKRKYWPTSNIVYAANRYRGMNFIIWRYADVLLDYAEVQYRLGNIAKEYEYMNIVRARAWKNYPESEWKRYPDVTFAPESNWDTLVFKDLSEKGYDKAFIDLIHEYFIEFAEEGGRPLQLMMRWENRVDIAEAFGYASTSIYPDRPWFQYPLAEIEKNPNITQNPGF